MTDIQCQLWLSTMRGCVSFCYCCFLCCCIREAFQSKKQLNLGISPNRGGGSSKNQKSAKFQLGKVPKIPKFQRVPKTNKIMTHFHLMRTQKYKMLSIVVLNMAKYTIISLILIDYLPIFNFFWRILRGSFLFKKVPSSKKSQPR